MRVIFSCLLMFLWTDLPGQAQDAPVLPGDEMMNTYLKHRAEELNDQFLKGAKTKDEWLKNRSELRREYLDMLGLWPLPERTPLHATVTGKIDHDDIVIEKIHYQSKPGLYVTGNLYRPAKIDGKLPAILYVCGHSGRGRDGNKTAFQDHGMWFASNGYVCFIIDTLQLGEIAGKHHGTYNLERFWWHSLGYTPAGVECWNGVRAIDYLVSRPEVDDTRIGVTGISGGGASTIWIAAADDRVRVAVPVSGMSDLQSYVTNRVINGHCDCMFLVNTYRWEWTTIAGLIAPRPLLFANSDMDPIFPMDGNRRIIARLRQLYKWFDHADLVDEHVSKGGHDYRPDLRVAIFQFFNKHLKNDTAAVKDADFKPLAGSELRVFAEDKDLPKDSINDKIDATFIKTERPLLPEAGEFKTWKDDLLVKLKEKSFRTFPEKLSSAEPAGEVQETLQPLQVEDGVTFHAISIVPAKAETTKGTLLILNPDEEVLTVTREWAKPFIDDRVVIAILPRGCIPSKWTRKNPPNYVERSHALLGMTVDTGRVRDVAGAARLFDERNKSSISWRVVGRGQAGVLAAYAALFEPAIKEVIIVDPPASHKNGPHFLNVLRVLDVPDALGMLAPTRLTLINSHAKAFDKTAAIYEKAGAANKFVRK